MKPINPNDERLSSSRIIPAIIIDVFNNLIIEKWNGNQATITHADALERIMSAQIGIGNSDITRQKVFDKGWMDIEFIFREEGWIVEYKKQCRGDNFPSHYVFRSENNIT